jgi:3-oxoacyl-[acyl-carrier-protein] synthase II
MVEKRRVVVTGIGTISPLGNKISDLWENLLTGKSGIAKITKFNASDLICQIAGEVKNFDPEPIIQKKDVRRLDIFSQYAILATEEAIQDSQFNIEQEDPTKCGVILGTGIGGLHEMESQFSIIQEKGGRRISPLAVAKLMGNAMVAEISIRYGLNGTSFVTSSACSSSAHAIAQAFRTIQYGEADVVITGGSETIVTYLGIAGFCAVRALSQRNDEPEKASRPFDKNRDGFVMGEGAGILILEEREHALQRNAKIYAELKGVACTSDAFHITQPHEDGKYATLAMTKALQDAQLNPDQIQYINAHGTSTYHNDRIETLAIHKAFGEHATKLAISSSKSMIGHLVGAAGAVEAIVTCLSIYYSKAHPTINLETPDPECDLDYIPNTAREFPIDNALSNSFGFGGHNVSLAFSSI